MINNLEGNFYRVTKNGEKVDKSNKRSKSLIKFRETSFQDL